MQAYFPFSFQNNFIINYHKLRRCHLVKPLPSLSKTVPLGGKYLLLFDRVQAYYCGLSLLISNYKLLEYGLFGIVGIKRAIIIYQHSGGRIQ